MQLLNFRLGAAITEHRLGWWKVLFCLRERQQGLGIIELCYAFLMSRAKGHFERTLSSKLWESCLQTHAVKSLSTFDRPGMT